MAPLTWRYTAHTSSLQSLRTSGVLRLACGRSGDRAWVGPRVLIITLLWMGDLFCDAMPHTAQDASQNICRNNSNAVVAFINKNFTYCFASQIHQIFSNIGVEIDNDSFQKLWTLAASRSNGQVSVESFRNVLDEVQAQKIAESAWWQTNLGNIRVAPPFYNALSGINYSLSNVTYIVAVGIYSVVCMVKQENNHYIAKLFSWL